MKHIDLLQKWMGLKSQDHVLTGFISMKIRLLKYKGAFYLISQNTLKVSSGVKKIVKKKKKYLCPLLPSFLNVVSLSIQLLKSEMWVILDLFPYHAFF